MLSSDYHQTLQKTMSFNLDENIGLIRTHIGDAGDLIIQKFTYAHHSPAAIIYLKSLTDTAALTVNAILPVNSYLQRSQGSLSPEEAQALLSSDIVEYEQINMLVSEVLFGKAVILFNNSRTTLAVNYPGFPRRPVAEPKTERIIRGSREGFVESLEDNLGMIRLMIKDSNLRVNMQKIGDRSHTEVAVLYLNDVANPDLVQEVQKRLQQIEVDGILDSGYIAEFITDNRLTIFPLVQSTERPDKVAAAILEGRVAIVVDRSPFALLVPVTSNEFYQTPEEFYFNYWVGTFLRCLRAVGTVLSVTLPAIYIAVIGVNPSLFPAGLTTVIASGRANIPYPLFFEVIFSLLIFEIFREAIVRVPDTVNVILGIAGGVLLGLVTLFSGLISGATIIVVIIATLATFSTANTEKEQAWRLVRYFLFFSASAFGLLGLVLSGLIVLAHMASLNSFGVSYLAPWSPPLPIDMVDGIFRLPWWMSKRRPPTYRPQQDDRMKSGKDEKLE